MKKNKDVEWGGMGRAGKNLPNYREGMDKNSEGESRFRTGCTCSRITHL